MALTLLASSVATPLLNFPGYPATPTCDGLSEFGTGNISGNTIAASRTAAVMVSQLRTAHICPAPPISNGGAFSSSWMALLCSTAMLASMQIFSSQLNDRYCSFLLSLKAFTVGTLLSICHARQCLIRVRIAEIISVCLHHVFNLLRNGSISFIICFLSGNSLNFQFLLFSDCPEHLQGIRFRPMAETPGKEFRHSFATRHQAEESEATSTLLPKCHRSQPQSQDGEDCSV